MFYFLFQCIRIFGLLRGLHIYINIKVLKTGKVILDKPKRQIFLRSDSADVHTFREIFLREEYKLSLPGNLPVSTIIDAGANIGFTTVYLSGRFPDAQILSLEPDSENFVLLQQNTMNSKFITPIQKALWNKSGFIKITDQGYGIRGFVVQDADAHTPGVVLPAISLTDLIREYNLNTIDILKMDIEGSEKEIFEGDTSWLAVTRCLVIELHDRMKPGCSKAVFQALMGYNFSCEIRGENLVFSNRDYAAGHR
jgi:FkbM family methyltransferase